MTLMTETPRTALSPIWDQWSREDFRRHLSLSVFRGMLRTPSGMPARSLARFTWDRISPKGFEFLVVNVNTSATTERHGAWTELEAIAHTVLHVENGTHCEGSEPTLWSDTERQLHSEAMVRMGWAALKCDVSDDAGELVPWAGASA